MTVQSLGKEDLLEREMATHSSILAWEIPWREEPGGLQSMCFNEVHALLFNKNKNKKLTISLLGLGL